MARIADNMQWSGWGGASRGWRRRRGGRSNLHVPQDRIHLCLIIHQPTLSPALQFWSSIVESNLHDQHPCEIATPASWTRSTSAQVPMGCPSKMGEPSSVESCQLSGHERYATAREPTALMSSTKEAHVASGSASRSACDTAHRRWRLRRIDIGVSRPGALATRKISLDKPTAR